MACTGRGSPSPRKAARRVGLRRSSAASGGAQPVDVDGPAEVEVVGDRVDVERRRRRTWRGRTGPPAAATAARCPRPGGRTAASTCVDGVLVERDGGRSDGVRPPAPATGGLGGQGVERRDASASASAAEVVGVEPRPGRRRPRRPRTPPSARRPSVGRSRGVGRTARGGVGRRRRPAPLGRRPASWRTRTSAPSRAASSGGGRGVAGGGAGRSRGRRRARPGAAP